MGTGSYKEIRFIIKGRIDFDYAEPSYQSEMFKIELEYLCKKYGVQIEDMSEER